MMMSIKTPTPYPDKVDLANAMKDVMRRRDARIRAEAYRNAIKIVTKHASPPHHFTGGLQIAQILDELGALADAEQEAAR